MKQAQISKIVRNSKITHCYIYKTCRGYYMSDYCGYTDSRTKAGVYFKEDAVKEAERCEDITILPINIIDHNKNIVDAIKDLSTRLI